MSKEDEIREIFYKNGFTCKKGINFYDWNKEFDFKCPDKDNCALTDLKEKREPIWTPIFGDERADVMLVAEAPSTTGRGGTHLGGRWETQIDYWERNAHKKKIENFKKFIEYFKNHLGYYPYFTDLVKCGPENTRNKPLILKRADFCGNRFLLDEIRIMDPTAIYCIGSTSFHWLRKHNLTNKKSGKSIEIKQLIHYSSQAGLPLYPEDKELIWKWQLHKSADDSDIPLSRLMFFHKGESRD